MLRNGVRIFAFFFFKQKTAYEMRISDWSSDVCSSDLAALHRVEQEQEHADQQDHRQEAEQQRRPERVVLGVDLELDGGLGLAQLGGQLVGQLLRVRDGVLVVVGQLAGDLVGAVLDGGGGPLAVVDGRSELDRTSTRL